MILWKKNKMYLWMQKSRLMEKKIYRPVKGFSSIYRDKWIPLFSKYVPKPAYKHLKVGLYRQVYKGSPYYTGLLSVYVRKYRQTIVDADTGKQQNEIIIRLWVYVFTFGWPSNFYRLHQRWSQ